MADTYSIIEAAARKHGVPVEALLAIGNIESGFNSAADNPYSSASGAFQFVDDTAREYGLTGDKRNDLTAQADAAARMAAKNSMALKATLGRTPSAGELYLAHQQGLSGAKALLLNPDRPAAEVLDRFHGGNGAGVVRKNGGNASMTAGDFAGKWVNKGNQVASRIPPGEVPSVGTLTDTRPPVPPVPVTPMPSTAAMRGVTSPTGGNADLQSALELYATREGNRVTPQMPPIRSVDTVASYPTTPTPPSRSDDLTAPGGVNAYVGGMQQDPSLSAALAGRANFNGDPMTPANGPVVDSIPSRPTPPMSRAPVSYAGQERMPRQAPSRAPGMVEQSMQFADAGEDDALEAALTGWMTGNRQSAQRPAITAQTRRTAADTTAMRGADQFAADAERNRTVVASFPTSNIGKPPVTRSVPSVAVPSRPTPPSNLTAARTEQGIQRSVAPPVSRAALPQIPAPPRGGSSVMDDYAYNTQPYMPRVNANAPDRLTAEAGLPEAFGNARVNGVGTRAVAVAPYDRPASPQLAALPSLAPQMPQMPRPRPAGGGQFGVASALDVVPQAMPALPPLAQPFAPIQQPFAGALNPSQLRRSAPPAVPYYGSLDPSLLRRTPGGVKPQQSGFKFPGFQLPGMFGLAQRGLGAMGFRPQAPNMPQAGGRGSGTVFGGGFLSGGGKQTSAVQAQINAGHSPSEAYDRANTAAVERAIAGASNPDQARRLNQSLGNI